MSKEIVYIFVEGGIVQHCSSTSGVEVVKIEVDKEMTPSLIKNLQDQILPEGEMKANINKNWAEVLRDYIGEEVDVESDGSTIQNEFRGILEEINIDTDGTFYATVLDGVGDYFNIDVLNVTIPDED